MTAPTRRQIMAGAISIVPAAGIAALPVLAADEPDPIFASIEAHRAAVLAFDAAVEVEFDLEEQLPEEACRSSVTAWEHVIVETDDPRWIAAIEARGEAIETADDMAWDLIEQTPPVTAAGAAALLYYADGEPHGRLREGWFPDNWHQEAYRAIAMTSIRLAGGAA